MFLENKENTNSSQPVGIELFAGGGGLALGLEQAGIKGIAFIEQNKAACNTLRKNRPTWNIIENDIHKVDFSAYQGVVDFVSGGAPCQAFSSTGKRMGFQDTRGTLFTEFARCLKKVQPKMFLFENVTGLLNHNCGRTFHLIYDTFTSLKYVVQYKVLDACYYGVGQKRKRLILIGIRNDLKDKLEFTYPEPDEHCTTLQKVLQNVPISPYIPYSEKKHKVMELVPPGGCWVDLPEKVAQEYMGNSYHSGGGRRGFARRLSWEAPCYTLTTSPSQKQTEFCHPDETRPLTVREYARIQAFPDNWIFEGTIVEQYRQIGNAVPVELARRIGVQIVKALKYGRKGELQPDGAPDSQEKTRN